MKSNNMKIEILRQPCTNSVTHRVAVYLQKRLTENHTWSGYNSIERLADSSRSICMGNNQKSPGGISATGKRIFEADVLILVTPEYNGSYLLQMKTRLIIFKQHHKPSELLRHHWGNGWHISHAVKVNCCSWKPAFLHCFTHMFIVPAVW